MIVVNGQPGESVSASDRGLAYGDGVFRTILVRNGRAQQWRRQYLKLRHDCTHLGIAAPDEQTLVQEVREASGAEPACVIKIVITRGAGERGYRYGEAAPTRIVMSAALPAYPPEYRDTGVRVRMCELQLAHQPSLAGVKHLNRLENVLARAEWDDAEIPEGILCDANGNAICGTMTNFFVATGGALSTPDLSRCGVAGVTRDRVIAAAARANISCTVRSISRGELFAADEMFVVNSVIGLWPVRLLNDRPLLVGAVTREIQERLDEDDDAQVA